MESFTFFSILYPLFGKMNTNPISIRKKRKRKVFFSIPMFFNTLVSLILLGLDFFTMIFPRVYIGAIAISFLLVMVFNIQRAKIHEKVLRDLLALGAPFSLSLGRLFQIAGEHSHSLFFREALSANLDFLNDAGLPLHLLLPISQLERKTQNFD